MKSVPAGLQVAVLALAFGAVPTIHAQGLLNVQRLSAALANELVGDTVAFCAKKGYKVVAVVVDLEGVRQIIASGYLDSLGVRAL